MEQEQTLEPRKPIERIIKYRCPRCEELYSTEQEAKECCTDDSLDLGESWI